MKTIAERLERLSRMQTPPLRFMPVSLTYGFGGWAAHHGTLLQGERPTIHPTPEEALRAFEVERLGAVRVALRSEEEYERILIKRGAPIVDMVHDTCRRRIANMRAAIAAFDEV